MLSKHLDSFLDFSRLEIASGGPDPHLSIAAYALQEVKSIPEKVWRAACYVGPYEVSTGSVIWCQWPLKRVRHDPEGFSNWITEHWKGWCIRRERRAARTTGKMTEALLSAAEFASTVTSLIDLPYDDVWPKADAGLRYYGRYALIKFLQTLHRGGAMQNGIPDIRPRGAWSPRSALALIYGKEGDQELIHSNDTQVLCDVQKKIDTLCTSVSKVAIRKASCFDIEVLLCNYRQAIERKYPGRPQDTDLGYYNKAKGYWGKQLQFPVLEVRKHLFPPEVLGELQGWNEPREQLGETYAKYNYFWCDTIYDFNATKDLAHPVQRNRKKIILRK